MQKTKPFYWWTSSFDWKLNLCHPKNNYEKAIIAIKGIIVMVVAQGSDLLKSQLKKVNVPHISPAYKHLPTCQPFSGSAGCG